MRTQIPSSLKWLAEKRARAASDLKKAQVAYRESEIQSKAISIQIAQLKEDVKALDRALRMHEVIVEGSEIPDIAGRKRVLMFPHGVVTRLIITYLKKPNEKWSGTNEIVSFVAAHAPNAITKSEYPEFRLAIRWRLKGMVRQGRIERNPTRRLNGQTHWRLRKT